MTSALVAAGCLVAALLLARPVPRGGRSSGWVLALLAVSALVGAVWAGVLLGATGIVAPAGVLMVLLGGGALLRRRHRAAADAAQTATLIQEVCEVLAAELASGRPVGRCLEDAVALWEPMSSVAMAHQLGAPVPDALRVLAGRPGAGDLTLVAAAWQVTQRSGGGLADSLAEVAGTLRERRATRRLVRSELSSARSTARLIAALPVLTLFLGSGTGGDPIGFLLTSPVGLACLGAGVLLTLLGLWWIEAIAGSVEAAA